MPRPQPDHPREIIAALDRTPYQVILRDTARRRQLVYDAMMDSTDPIARELGQQLRSGSAAPRDLVRLPEYREFVTRSLAAGARLDLHELASVARTVASDGRLTGDLQRDVLQVSPATERSDKRTDRARDQRDRDVQR